MLRSGFLLAFLAASAAAQSPDPTQTGLPENGVKAGATYDGETVSGLSGGAKRATLYHGSLQAQRRWTWSGSSGGRTRPRSSTGCGCTAGTRRISPARRRE